MNLSKAKELEHLATLAIIEDRIYMQKRLLKMLGETLKKKRHTLKNTLSAVKLNAEFIGSNKNVFADKEIFECVEAIELSAEQSLQLLNKL